MNKKSFLVIGFVLLCIAFSANVKAQAKVDDKESARLFVQKFYDWYLVLWSDPIRKMSVLDIAIKKHPEYFGRELKDAVAIDDSAQKKSDEIVGLDFDPFIGQELWGKFEVGDIRKTGQRYLVGIREFENGDSSKGIQAIEQRYVVELVRKNEHWAIVNVKYPPSRGGGDILKTLKDLKKDREHQ